MNIVCLSTIDWDFLWQRHQAFMSQFAHQGWTVYYVENTGFRNPGPGDYRRVIQKFKGILPRISVSRKDRPTSESGTTDVVVVDPLVAPPNGRLYRKINESVFVPLLLRRLRRLGLDQVDLAFVYLPSNTTVEILKRLDPRYTIFDCVANFAAHPERPRDYERIEGELLNRCNAVITDSDFLYGMMKRKHANVVQIHHGVDISVFEQMPLSDTIGHRKGVCFYGTIDDRMDWDALAALVGAGVHVDLVGPKKVHVPIPVRCLDPVPYSALPDLLDKYVALIIPYKVNDFTMGIVPAKLYECMATGKPILVSNLPSFKEYNGLVYICNSPDDYVSTYRNLVSTETEALRHRRRECAASQSLEVNFQRVTALIERCMET